MARGDDPWRTPFYGARLMAAAFLSCRLAASVDRAWLSAVIYDDAAVAGFVGSIMTLRDVPSSRRR